MTESNICQFCEISPSTLYNIFKCEHKFCETCVFYSLFRYFGGIAIKDEDFRSKFFCPSCNDDSTESMEDFIYACNPNKFPNVTKICESCHDARLYCYCYICKVYFCKECLDKRHNKIKSSRGTSSQKILHSEII